MMLLAATARWSVHRSLTQATISQPNNTVANSLLLLLLLVLLLSGHDGVGRHSVQACQPSV
jgi:hypothetical protein